MTKTEAAKIVTVLMAAFPSNRANANTTLVYEDLLADLDYAQVNIAVRRLLTTSRFMPSIAEIREAALQLERGPLRAGGEAWGDVLCAVRKYGVYRLPEFDDPVVAHAVGSLGWVEICNSENQVADRARFVELYDKLAATQRREQQAPPLLRLDVPLRERKAVSAGEAIRAIANPVATFEDWQAAKAGVLGDES